jgi:hypothetical protein
MFDTHKLNEKGFEEMQTYKKIMADAVSLVARGMPEGREKAIFLTKMEEGVFFGAKALAAKDGNHTEVVKY